YLNTHKKPSQNIFATGWRKIQQGADGGLQWFAEHIYQPAIEFALRFRYGLLMVFMMLFIIVFSMPFNGTIRMSFFPAIPGDTVRANISMHKDVSFGRTHETLIMMERKAYETDKALREDADSAKSGIAN